MIFSISKKLNDELTKLDRAIETKGFFTKTDLFVLNIPKWVKHFIIFGFKRNGDWKYHYQCNGNTYESIYDIEKNERPKAEIIFSRVESECSDL